MSFFLKAVLPFMGILAIAITLLIGFLTMCENRPIESRMTIKEYQGHSYIIYRDGYRGGITHNPDCHNCSQKDN